MKKNDILELIFEERIQTALSKALSNDSAYKKANRKANRKADKLDCRLSKKQRLAVDRVLSAYNYSSSEYAKLAYCFCFLIEMIK